MGLGVRFGVRFNALNRRCRVANRAPPMGWFNALKRVVGRVVVTRASCLEWSMDAERGRGREGPETGNSPTPRNAKPRATGVGFNALKMGMVIAV
jgi:hypothetical protein